MYLVWDVWEGSLDSHVLLLLDLSILIYGIVRLS